jgi:hypothetical protein
MLRHRLTTIVTVLILLAAVHGYAQERFGGITGQVTDPSQGALPGATITATNKATGAMRTTVSSPDGTFALRDLEPGRYTVSVELQGFQKLEGSDVLVLLGRTIDFPAQLQLGQLSETVQVTGETSRQIDARSTAITHNITSEEIDRMPKARSFQGLALTAPSVNQGQIEGGFQVNGASGAENAFTVDGVVTNSLVNGRSRQDTVFEYLQEVQVKTAGIEAEFGGALGGVISAVTKSGGNQFRGEAHYYYNGNGLSAGPVKRLVLDPATEATASFVQDEKQRNDRNELGGSIGGPIVRDHLFFFASASPRLTRRTNNYSFSNGTEPGSIDQDVTDHQMFGKLTFSTSRFQANGSVLATPTRSTGTLLAYNGVSPQYLSSSLAANQPNVDRGWKQDQTNTSGNVDYFLSGSSSINIRGGYFYDNYADTGIPNTTSVTWNNSNAVNLTSIPAELRLPQGAFNTPRAQIASFDKTQRGFVNADYNLSVSAAGQHLFKGGVGVQKVQNDVDVAYPGGYVLLNWDAALASTSSVAGGRGTYGYYEVNDRGTVGTAGSTIYSIYVQDQWTVGNRLTLNLGVRTENEKVPTFRPEVKKNAIEFGFRDKIAPRLGATYDVFADGRFKLFGAWGRYYDWTKYELARGSFGGDIWYVYYRSLDTLDVHNLNLSNMPGRDLWQPAVANSRRDRRAPSINNVDPDLRPMSQDQFNIGSEFQVNPTSVFGVHVIHNNLRETVEDLGAIVNGDEVYVIGNPGRGISTVSPISGATPEFDMPKPKRQYDALELTFNRRFSNNWFAGASYTFSRLYGNYAGLASSDEITTPTTGVSSAQAQQQTGDVARQGGNANRAWDLDEIMWDARGNLGVEGRLATDRPHVVKLYGAYSLPFGTQIGGFFYGGSGTPISTYVNTSNQIPVFVNGRGDMGRTPFLTRTDLLLTHEFNLLQSRRLRLELNIINLFNQKTATHLFNYLNKGAGLARGDAAIDLSHVDLSKGYDYNALILAAPSGRDSYDPRYGMADLFQAGTQGQFSVKFLF